MHENATHNRHTLARKHGTYAAADTKQVNLASKSHTPTLEHGLPKVVQDGGRRIHLPALEARHLRTHHVRKQELWTG